MVGSIRQGSVGIARPSRRSGTMNAEMRSKGFDRPQRTMLV
jgi:hypothetical protein